MDLTTQATWLMSNCWIQTHVLSGAEPLQSSLTHCAHACNSPGWSLPRRDGQLSGMFHVAFTISTLIRGRCRHEALTWPSSLHMNGTVAFLDWGSSSPRCSFFVFDSLAERPAWKQSKSRASAGEEWLTSLLLDEKMVCWDCAASLYISRLLSL